MSKKHIVKLKKIGSTGKYEVSCSACDFSLSQVDAPLAERSAVAYHKGNGTLVAQYKMC
jgi:hypothetical protein